MKSQKLAVSKVILIMVGITLFISSGIYLGGSTVPSDQWQAREAPLMTEWAKDVTPDNVHPEYPRPQMVRQEWMNLNGLWEYAPALEGEQPPVGKELSGKILVPFPVESALSGVMEHHDRLWYRRTFSIPESWEEKVVLHFGAVDWEAVVYVNGKQLGMHRGGYDAFQFDITEALLPSGEQELIVGVFDPTNRGVQPAGKQVLQPGGIFYTSSTGIWQTVWLEPLPAVNITGMEMNPDIDAGILRLKVFVDGFTDDHIIEAAAFDGDEQVAMVTGKAGVELTLSIADAKLWAPGSPFLYDLNVALKDNGETVDRVDSYFGMRKVSLGKDDNGITRIFLNNKFIFQIGPLDQGFWPDGLHTAPTDEALRFDIEIAQKLGFNMIRKHTKIEPARWYYWCDKLGMLVWQDMASPNQRNFRRNRSPETDKQFEYELMRMVEGFRNHPSIIMWIIFNEGWGQFDTGRFTQMVKTKDPDRLVNNASGWRDMNVGDIVDVHSYPGPDAPAPEPGRAAVLGEFGGLGLPIENHTWSSESWGYRNLTSMEELKDRYELLFDRMWQFKDDPGLSAAVYTQITDVETEVNGLLTYDRKVLKLKVEAAQAFHKDEMVSPPKIEPDGESFIDVVTVSLSNRKGESIRYTLDGSEPSNLSNLYTRPITIESSTTLKARSFDEAGNSSSVYSAVFEKMTFKEAQTDLPELVEGIAFEYFEGSWEQLPDFDQVTPVKSGITDTIDLKLRNRDDNIGLRFTGYIQIQNDGVYTFFTRSDDGSKLYIGGEEIVNNDGIHGMREEQGKVALKAGMHTVRVIFFQGASGHGLEVRYEGPGIEKQIIPANVLFVERVKK